MYWTVKKDIMMHLSKPSSKWRKSMQEHNRCHKPGQHKIKQHAIADLIQQLNRARKIWFDQWTHIEPFFWVFQLHNYPLSIAIFGDPEKCAKYPIGLRQDKVDNPGVNFRARYPGRFIISGCEGPIETSIVIQVEDAPESGTIWIFCDQPAPNI